MKVSCNKFSVCFTCSYIPPQSDPIEYYYHLNAIVLVASLVTDVDLLIVLGDFNKSFVRWLVVNDSLSLIPDNSHEFINGLSNLSLEQINPVCNIINRTLNLLFVLDTSNTIVFRIDTLVTLEDQNNPTLNVFIN